MKKNKNFKNKNFDWADVKVTIAGKDITGIKAIKIEETGLQIDKTLGLQPILKISDAETGKEIK